MLSRLSVRNYVLIDSLEIDFPEGLIIITGQTGAGKSILLGALGLVMGSKADASMLAEGADSCVVEAEFDVNPEDAGLKAVLEENDVEWDNGHLIIRRVLNRSGRSRAFVNDSPVQVTVLQDIASQLIDVHSQHQTMLLSDRNFQLSLLDHFAGATSLRSNCADIWSRLSLVRRELSDVDARLNRLSAERDYNEAQFRQLDAASIREGELAELEEEQKQLANAEEIKTGLCAAEELFTSSTEEIPSIDSALKEAGRLLVRTGRYIPFASELAERVDSCRAELDDILSEISSLNSRVEVSGDRLEAVESRMSLIYGLFQKHGCSDESELMALRDRLSDALYDSDALEEKRNELKKAVAQLENELEAVAAELHEMRLKASVPFAESITESIRNLELPYAVFTVGLLPASVGSAGKDNVQFLFSASGKNPVEVAKCASGGEKSRIMLALKAMMARFTKMPTMIFDEIDTGVSGSVADKMGTMICEMGRYMQVFAITHLPQVAAKGSAHYLVTKEIDPETSVAVSSIKRLSDKQRVLEVARMLSGSVLTEAAIANAESLLNS